MAWFPTHWEDVYLASDPEVSGNRGGVGVCANAQRCPWERSRMGETAASIVQGGEPCKSCENTEKRWHVELCGVGLNGHQRNSRKNSCLNMTNVVVPRRTLSHRIIKHSLYENIERQDLSHSKVLLLLAELAHKLNDLDENLVHRGS